MKARRRRKKGREKGGEEEKKDKGEERKRNRKGRRGKGRERRGEERERRREDGRERGQKEDEGKRRYNNITFVDGCCSCLLSSPYASFVPLLVLINGQHRQMLEVTLNIFYGKPVYNRTRERINLKQMKKISMN